MVTVYFFDFLKNTNVPMTAAFSAYKGFQAMGAHCEIVSQDPSDMEKENPAVGGIGFVKQRLKTLGVEFEPVPDYPKELVGFLGREVWESTINRVSGSSDTFFIKPKDKEKFFTGCVYTGPKSLIGKGIQGGDYPVYCSEVVDMVAEFRAFVRYGKILDIRRYRGDLDTKPDFGVVSSAVSKFRSAPNAYSLDFFVNKYGRTFLVEANDAYALGDYGLFYLDYTKLVYTRWSQIVECNDFFNF